MNERICKLENETLSSSNTATVKAVNKLQKSDVAMAKEIQDIKSKMDLLIAGFQSMQNQINMLFARP